MEQALDSLESQVAALHVKAKDLNLQGGEAEAVLAYQEMARLDDEALMLQLANDALPREAVLPPSVRFSPLVKWDQAANGQRVRQRALGSILGAALGDAAACSVQWVYSLDQLSALAEGKDGLEFYDPPQCPFFDYPLGSASPYGEQTCVLLKSLVEVGGFDASHFAGLLFHTFGLGYEGYRDRAMKSFLRRYSSGHLPPHTGCEDDQANAFTKLPPIVALYAGSGRAKLLEVVECMIRVTQNDNIAVSYGCAAALVLEAVLLGSTVTAALALTVEWIQAAAVGNLDEAAADIVPSAVWAKVAAQLLEVAALAGSPPRESCIRLGRNCHLPNSLQTPLLCLLHWEYEQQVGLAENKDHIAATLEQQPQQQGNSRGEQAPKDKFCLPCSLDGCAVPTRTSYAGDGKEWLAAALAQNQHSSGFNTDAYVEVVRLAVGLGGCASRSSFVGALAGAMLVGGPDQLPPDWALKMLNFGEVEALGQRLVGMRD